MPTFDRLAEALHRAGFSVYADDSKAIEPHWRVLDAMAGLLDPSPQHPVCVERVESSPREPFQAAVDGRWLARGIVREPTYRDGPLAGLKFVAKDLFAIAGEITRAGSAAFDHDPPAEVHSALVAKALDLGAELIGTTNMDALAYGFVCDNPIYGRARNPHDAQRICGGSSGGSAAFVAAGLVPFALGTDTSGSIRVPAAFCGTWGFRPSECVFDQAGVAPLSPTFDRAGLFARDGNLLARIASLLAQPGALAKTQRSPNRFGFLGGYFASDVALPVIGAVRGFAKELGAAGDVDLPGAAAARAAAYILVADEAAQVHRLRLLDRANGIDAQTSHRLVAAALIDDGLRAKAMADRTEFHARLDRLFGEFDVLIAPCVASLAPTFEALGRQAHAGAMPLRASLGRFTQPFSLAGCPVVAVPLATDAGLPTAVQLIGPIGSDAMLLGLAEAIENEGRIRTLAPLNSRQ